MSDQREHPQETPAAARSALSPASNPPADRPRSDPQIEDYLDQICAPLVGWVPYAARSELRAELQAHLESLVAAYQELGSSPDAAVHGALAQSGDPQVVAGEWVREWERSLPPRKAPSAWRSTFVALVCFGYATSAGFALILAAQSSGSMGPLWSFLLFGLLVLLLPFTAGLATGLCSPARPARAVLAALMVLIPPTTLALPWLFRYTPIDRALLIGWIQSMTWIPIGCGAAMLGSRLRARHEETRRRWMLPA